MTPLLLLSHFLAFVLGGGVAYFLTIRFVNARLVDGHTALEIAHPGETMPETVTETVSKAKLATVLLVASFVVVGIGVQAWLATNDNEERDRQDRVYADCLTDFAADLVKTIELRTQVNTKVTKAAKRKDAALDELLVLTLSAQNSGATDESQLDPALVARYKEVLKERVAAQQAYDRAFKKANETRKENQYQSPKAVCSR